MPLRASPFSSGFSFMAPRSFFLLPHRLLFKMRWMPHSNSSSFLYPSLKLNYMKLLQDVYTRQGPAQMTIYCDAFISGSHSYVSLLFFFSPHRSSFERNFYDVSALPLLLRHLILLFLCIYPSSKILYLNYFSPPPRRKFMRILRQFKTN